MGDFIQVSAPEVWKQATDTAFVPGDALLVGLFLEPQQAGFIPGMARFLLQEGLLPRFVFQFIKELLRGLFV